jgi:PAS domain S-box-containing protein
MTDLSHGTHEPLERILERAALGIAQMDTSGRYLLVNDRYCELLGRSRAQLLDTTLRDVTHPADVAASLDAFIRAMESGAAAVIDQRCVRGDGSSVWIGNSVSVGRDAQGNPQYVLAIAQDITERKETERALSRAQADLRLLLDSAAEGFYCIDREGATTLCNAAFLRMLGLAREEDAIGRDLHPVIHRARADGSPFPKEESPILKAAQYGAHAHVTGAVMFRVDGTSFPVDYWVRPIVRDAEIQGAVCTIADASGRKQADALQELLNHELAHRVKNTLAIVQAIVGQTLREAATPRDAMQAVNSRLIALGNAHSVLTRSRWGNAALVDVIEGAIATHRSAPPRIHVSGPRVELGAKSALAITLALHELCTNAAKYGALSNDSGSASIEWSVAGGAADARFRLSWQERGGPPVAEPTRKGFGSRVISEPFGADFDGAARLAFDPRGVVWTLEAPLTELKK